MFLRASAPGGRNHPSDGRAPFTMGGNREPQRLDAERWPSYFDGISAQTVAIEVVGRSRERVSRETTKNARALPLRSISFDPDREVLQLELGIRGAVLRHFISAPRVIDVATPDADGSTEIHVDDASGTRTRIWLRVGPGIRREAPVIAIETARAHAHRRHPPHAGARARHAR